MPLKWFTKVLRHYADFRGRAGRPEYWWFVLIYVVIALVLLLADHALGTVDETGEAGLLSGLFVLGTLLPNLAVSARRLHDTGRSAWWLLLWFAPCGGFIILYFTVEAGNYGANRFGPDPRAEPS